MSVETARAANETVIADLGASLKWVLGSAGVLTAFVAGGLQLTAPQLEGTTATVVGYTVALVLALGCSLAALLAAARVLVTPRHTAMALAAEEVTGLRVAGRRLDEPSVDTTPDVVWIQDEQGPALLGTARSVTDLIQRTQHATSPEEREEAFARLGLVESAVHLRKLQKSVTRMLWHAGWVAPVFVVAIACLVVVPTLGAADGEDGLMVTEPIPVRVVVAQPSEAGIKKSCGTELIGFAIGGTLDNPQLVLEPSGTCAAMKLDDAEGLIVFPLADEP